MKALVEEGLVGDREAIGHFSRKDGLAVVPVAVLDREDPSWRSGRDQLRPRATGDSIYLFDLS